MEPAESEDRLTEGLLLVDKCEGLADVTVKSLHVRLDIARRLNRHLHRSLK